MLKKPTSKDLRNSNMIVIGHNRIQEKIIFNDLSWIEFNNDRNLFYCMKVLVCE